MKSSNTLLLLLSTVCLLAHANHDPQKKDGHQRVLSFVRVADMDHNGDVSSVEWQSFLDELVVDEDGAINPESFHEYMERHRPGPPQYEAGEQRGPRNRRGHRPPPGHERGDDNPFDRDGDGILEIDDLNDIFTTLDKDDDGNLQPEELPKPPRRHRR